MLGQWRSGLGIFLRGFAMGCADLVPGVSGGTIALITHIYERLIRAITHFDLQAVRLLLSGQWAAMWRHFDGAFLLVLLLGILTAIFTLANSVAWLLANQPLLVWAFFSGLILASAIFLLGQLEVQKALPQLGLTLFGVVLVTALGYLRADLSDPALPVVFAAGFIAISAMLLPGISGSFILLVLGLYEPTLEAVRSLEWAYFASFGLGAAGGFLVFSRLIEWLLQHFHHQTLMFLVGLLFGSLSATWPWKGMSAAGRPADNLSPTQYAELFGSAQVLQVTLVFLVALALVWAIEWLGRARLDGDASAI